MTHRTICLLLAAVAAVSSAVAERLPIREYGTADGLPHSSVRGIRRDARGYLWFSTPIGLARFDGRTFQRFGDEEGLPDDGLGRSMEDSRGMIWIGCWSGVIRFDPRAPAGRRSSLYPLRLPGGRTTTPVDLIVDRSGRLWVGAIEGLFVLPAGDREASFRMVPLDGAPGVPAAPRLWGLLEDRRGDLWMATGGRLLRRSRDGSVSVRPVMPGRDLVDVRCLLEDRGGRIWVGHEHGVTIIHPPHDEAGDRTDHAMREPAIVRPAGTGPRLPSPGGTTWLAPGDGIGRGIVTDLLETSDGHVWICRFKEGLTEFDGAAFRQYSGEALGGIIPGVLAEDPTGDLWIGTADRGALRIARNGITSWDQEDGLGYTRLAAVVETASGEIAVVAGPSVFRFDGARFHDTRPAGLERLDTGRAEENPVVLVDHADAWWMGTPRGLIRFDGVRRVKDLAGRRPSAAGEADGLPGGPVRALLEDSRRDIWIGAGGREPVLRWERATGRVHRYGASHGLPGTVWPLSFAEDQAGQIWVGLSRGVARFRDGTFTHFTREDGLTAVSFTRPWVDGAGRLWILSMRDGVARVDDPAAGRPAFTGYDRTTGLSSNSIRCAAEDGYGRIYFGTLAGLDRLDLLTGRIRRFTTADGLSNDEIAGALRDRAGNIWVTSVRGVSRLVPAREDPRRPDPPDAWITGLRVAGEPRPISPIGEGRIAGVRVDPGRNLQVEFGSVSFGPGGVRFQYRLEGDDDRWSEPAETRIVHYASLRPGSYRFQVRAVDAEGRASPRPAIVTFLVLPPVWLRWWFLSLCVLAAAVMAAAVYRARIARAVALERIRTRIATDLHDDVGASLSHIALLSDITRTRPAPEDGLDEALSRIAAESREMVDAMSDIVWAVNPARDHLGDLRKRMRRLASDFLSARGIPFTFTCADPDELPVGADLRREVYLVFKECLHNAARHSACRSVAIDLRRNGDALELTVIDDGRGFDTTSPAEGGHGLLSMRQRAARLGGALRLSSRPGAGTTVRLRIPRTSPVRRGWRRFLLARVGRRAVRGDRLIP